MSWLPFHYGSGLLDPSVAREANPNRLNSAPYNRKNEGRKAVMKATNGARFASDRFLVLHLQDHKALEAQVTQSRVVIGTPALGPAEEAIRPGNPYIVDARMAVMRDPFSVKSPVFVFVRTVPLPPNHHGTRKQTELRFDRYQRPRVP